jgi:hypothetical protein
MQLIKNRQRQSKSIATFCRVFHPRSERGANTARILINAPAIRNVRNFKKTNNGGHFESTIF